MFKMKKFLSVALAMVIMLSVTSNAFATENSYTKYVDPSSSDTIYIPSDDVTDKVRYGEELDLIIAQERGPSKRGGVYNISDKDTLTHNGSSLYSKFASEIDWDYIESSKVSGSSRAAWLGSNPMDADRITLSDKISFGGIVIGVSTSGADWSTTMTSASWSASLDDEWQIDHTYSDISCTGYDLYVKQVSTGDFKFGTKYYTTSATDSKFL